MAGPQLAGDNPNKIKGGKWTVFRFFLVSTAYTSVWLAISSQLGNYRELFGPQILLQLNIAYFLPSIPLLIVSGIFDKVLEAKLGVARTVLFRLLVGLLGYLAVCSWFPFQPVQVWYLLGSTVALGLFSGIAFSASYQLVARFANKNVIALGLGCSASGPLVLLLQIAFGVGEEPRKRDEVLLYETIAVVVAAGLWATLSLLVRHWDAIEGFDQRNTQQGSTMQEPLLGLQEAGGRQELAQPPSPAPALVRHPSLPPLIDYNSLEPYQTFLGAEEEFGGAAVGQSASWSEGSLLGSAAEEEEEREAAGGRGSGDFGGAGAPRERRNSDPGSRPIRAAAVAEAAGGDAPGSELRLPHRVVASLRGRVSFNSMASNLETGSPHFKPASPSKAGQQEDMQMLAWAALCQIWPALCALGLSGTISLVLFPFFTYIPTSGLLGEALPKTLFFVRIFADIVGRFLPRLNCLATHNPLAVLVVALGKLACVPAYFLYLKSPDRFHSDTLAVAFVIVVWTIGGYINTMANMLAPRLVQPRLKATAAGLMAITYQTAHFLGLLIATMAAILLYGDIGVK